MPATLPRAPVIVGIIVGALTMILIAVVGDLTWMGFLVALVMAGAVSGALMYREVGRNRNARQTSRD